VREKGVSERDEFTLNFYGLFANLFRLYMAENLDKNSGLNLFKNQPQSQVNFVVKKSILMAMLV